MATSIADLNIRISANTVQLSRGLAVAGADLVAFQAKALAMSAAAAALAAPVSFVGFGVRVAAEIEQAEVAFQSMTGSAEEAADMIQKIREYAAVTPLTTRQLIGDARLLMNFQVATDKVLPTLKLLANVSGGSADRLHHLTLAFGQMSSAGRVLGQDLNQMTQAGWTPLPAIMQRTGESFIEIKKRMEDGRLSVHEVNIALIDAAMSGDKMAAQSRTLSGRWSTLTDETEMLAGSLGEQLVPKLHMVIASFRMSVSMADRFSDAVGRAASFAESGLNKIGGNFPAISKAFDVVGKAFDKGAAQFDKSAASMAAEQMAAMRAAEEELLASQKKLQDQNALKSWADNLTQSLRTPFEVARDEITKIDQAFQAGVLSVEYYQRAIDQVGESFSKATAQKKELSQIDRGTGAVTRFSSAGFSAVASAGSAAQLAAFNKQIAGSTASSAETLKSLLEQVRSSKTTLVAAGVR